MPSKKRKAKEKASGYQLDAFAVGGIAALTHEGYSFRQIEDSGAVKKADGSVVPFDTVGKVVRRLKRDKNWRGQRKEGSGRLRTTTAEEDEAMVQCVKDNRGREIMTSGKVKRRLGVSSARLVRRRPL